MSAVLVEVLGLLLPDKAVRVNVALRLGTRVQHPHCCRCGAMSDAKGDHSLPCHRNPGRLPCHTTLNDVMYRALAAAGLLAILSREAWTVEMDDDRTASQFSTLGEAVC